MDTNQVVSVVAGGGATVLAGWMVAQINRALETRRDARRAETYRIVAQECKDRGLTSLDALQFALEPLKRIVNENAAAQNKMADAIGYLQQQNAALWQRVQEHDTHAKRIKETNVRVGEIDALAHELQRRVDGVQRGVEFTDRNVQALRERLRGGAVDGKDYTQLKADVATLAQSNNDLVAAIEALSTAYEQSVPRIDDKLNYAVEQAMTLFTPRLVELFKAESARVKTAAKKSRARK